MVMTGSRYNTEAVVKLMQLAHVSGTQRFVVPYCDYPTVTKAHTTTVALFWYTAVP